MKLKIDRCKWEKVRLGDVATEYSKRVSNPRESGFDRFVGNSNIGQWDFRVKSWESTSSVTSAMKLFEPNDYLLVRRSLYASDFRERAPRAHFGGVCSGDILTIRENPERIADGFLIGVLNNPSLWKFIVANASGSITRRIKWKDLANYEFLLPTKEHQLEIAELLWAIDKLIENQINLAMKNETLLQSFILDSTNMVIDEYGTKILEDLVQDERPITYGILKPGKGVIKGIPVIKVRDYPNGEVIQEKLLKTTKEIEEPYKRSRLKKDDILFSIRGTVGRIAEVPSELEGANITQDTARISLKPGINHVYLRSILESDFFQNQVRVRITGLAVQGINLGELRKLKVPLPSENEQNSIAEKILRIEAAISSVQSEIDALQQLKKSLINQVFQA